MQHDIENMLWCRPASVPPFLPLMNIYQQALLFKKNDYAQSMPVYILRHGRSHSSIADISSKLKEMNKRIRNTNTQGANDWKNNGPRSKRINGQAAVIE